MIYDKNQFAFNIILILILTASILLNAFYATNFTKLNGRLDEVNKILHKVEDNQAFNYLQGSHNPIDFQLITQGLLIQSANDFGTFNGPSMQPSMFDGNTAIQVKYEQTKLNEGQIIRFIRPDSTAVIHRVRADYGDTVFVQGDSLKEGEIISKDKITHIVIGVLFT